MYQYYRTPTSGRTRDHLEVRDEYWNLSRASFKQYAKEIGAEYKFLSHEHKLDPFYGVFLPFEEGWVNDYDAVCFTDSDMLVTTNYKNVFEESSKDSISGYFMTTGAWKNKPRLEFLKDQNGHMNSGCVVIPRSQYGPLTNYIKSNLSEHHKKVIANDPIIGALGKYDQAFFNLYLCEQKKAHKLDHNFNYHLGRLAYNEKRWDATFIHYHRGNKHKMKDDWKDSRVLK